MLALEQENNQLRRQIQERDEIINDLRSQVDKYKSVLSIYDGYLSPGHTDLKHLKPRKTRLMGISAEPESSLTHEELLKTKFTNYQKSDR